jgi:hypothetical protein
LHLLKITPSLNRILNINGLIGQTVISMDIARSIQLLEGIHARWLVLLKSLSASELGKTFIPPEHGKNFV